MTEKTIKDVAKELAGAFYEDNRSDAFRKTFPTLKAYMRGQWHQPNGDITINKPGWMYHIDLARKILVTMLGLPDSRVAPVLKERIYDALIDDHNQATSPKAKKVTQRLNTTPH